MKRFKKLILPGIIGLALLSTVLGAWRTANRSSYDMVAKRFRFTSDGTSGGTSVLDINSGGDIIAYGPLLDGGLNPYITGYVFSGLTDQYIPYWSGDKFNDSIMNINSGTIDINGGGPFSGQGIVNISGTLDSISYGPYPTYGLLGYNYGTGVGVGGWSSTGYGGYFRSDAGIGVYGNVPGLGVGIQGVNMGGGVGVAGFSTTGYGAHLQSDFGIAMVANIRGTGIAIYGSTTEGTGAYILSQDGVGAYIEGNPTALQTMGDIHILSGNIYDAGGNPYITGSLPYSITTGYIPYWDGSTFGDSPLHTQFGQTISEGDLYVTGGQLSSYNDSLSMTSIYGNKTNGGAAVYGYAESSGSYPGFSFIGSIGDNNPLTVGLRINVPFDTYTGNAIEVNVLTGTTTGVVFSVGKQGNVNIGNPSFTGYTLNVSGTIAASNPTLTDGGILNYLNGSDYLGVYGISSTSFGGYFTSNGTQAGLYCYGNIGALVENRGGTGIALQAIGSIETDTAYYLTGGTIPRRFILSGDNLSIQAYTGGGWLEISYFIP